MAGLIDAVTRGSRFSAPKAALRTSAASSGPPPTSLSPERPGQTGPGVGNFPIFNPRPVPQRPPAGSPADDWTVYGPDGKPIPYGQWPNQNPTSGDEVARRREEQRRINEAIASYQNSLNSGIAGINDSRAAMMLNQAARNAGYGQTASAYQRQLAGQLAEANLDIRAADIQLGNMPQWQSFLAQQWGNRMTAGRDELNYIGQQGVNNVQQRLIEWRGIQQGRREVGQQAERATRDATSAATVSGVIQGAKQDFADIETERGNALYGLDLEDQQSRLNETQRRQELSNRRSQLMADLTSFDISTREQQARLREREQLLGIEAQRARLKPQQLQDAMAVTLSRLGLEQTMSTGQFLESMANASAQERALIDQFLRNAYATRGG